MEREILQKNIEPYALINEAKIYTEKKTPLGRINKSLFDSLLMPAVQILHDCCNSLSVVTMLTVPQVAAVLSLLIICRCFNGFSNDKYHRNLVQSADMLSTCAFDFVVGYTSPRIVRLQRGS